MLAWADDSYTSLNTGVTPVLSASNYTNQTLQTGAGAVQIELNPDLFLRDGNPSPADAPIGSLQLGNYNMGGGESFSALFGTPSFQISSGRYFMTIPIISGTYTSDIPFSYSLYFTYPPSATSQDFLFSGVIKANTQSPGGTGTGTSTTSGSSGISTGFQITGWSSSQASQRHNQTIAPGGYATYDALKSANIFAYTGTGLPTNVTDAIVNEFHLSARTNRSDITAQLQKVSSGEYRVQVVVGQDVAAGTYDVDVELYSANGRIFGSLLYSMLSVKVDRDSTTITGNKITGINEDSVLGSTSNGIWGSAQKNGKTLPTSNEALDDLWINPGDEIYLYFDSDTFEWDNDAPQPPTTALTTSILRRGDVSVKVLNGRHSDLLDTVELRYKSGKAYVYVKFVEKFISTKDVDFEIEIVLTQKGKYVKGSEAYLAGTIGNEFDEVYEGMDYIDLSNGEIVEATDTVNDIEVDLGEGVSILTKLIKGRLYYGVATLNDLDKDDEKILDDYADVELVYHLATIGLNGDGKTVKIDTSGEYYVYNRYMEYAGTTNEMLPYSTKYYLSTKKLNSSDTSTGSTGGDDGNEPESYPYYESAPPTAATPGPTGGNNNSNPNTGR